MYLRHSRYLRPFALSLSCFRRGRPARTSLNAGGAYVSADGVRPGHDGVGWLRAIYQQQGPLVLARLRGFTGRKRYFPAIGAGYYLDIPRRYFAATVENRCSEDLPYFRASIRVPTIVLRELELAQRHENQAKSSSARCPSSLCSDDLFG